MRQSREELKNKSESKSLAREAIPARIDDEILDYFLDTLSPKTSVPPALAEAALLKIVTADTQEQLSLDTAVTHERSFKNSRGRGALAGVAAMTAFATVLGGAIPANAATENNPETDTTEGSGTFIPESVESLTALTPTVSVETTEEVASTAETDAILPVSGNTQSNATVGAEVAIDTTIDEPTETVDEPVVITNTTAPVSTTTGSDVSIDVSVEYDTDVEIDTTPVAVSVKPAAESSPISSSITVNTVLETSVETATDPITVSSPKSVGAQNLTLGTDVIVSSKIDASLTVDAEGKPIKFEAITPVIVKPVIEGFDIPKIERRNATPEQITASEAIAKAIKNADVLGAAALIKEHFHDENIKPTSFNNGKPVYEEASPAFIANISELLAKFDSVRKAKGHDNAGYVDTTLAALSVYLASASDPSVLNSEYIQSLVANAKAPAGDYENKLFSKHLEAAKATLTADLLKGLEKLPIDITAGYAFITMANQSTAEQIAAIEAIKAEEAAEAARKLALEAANGNYSQSAEAQAMQNLYEREGDPAKKRAFYIMNQIMAQTGLSALRVAAIMGNLSVESASTFDPSVDQRNYGGGNAKGIAQWEGTRFSDRDNNPSNDLVSFARQRGTEWNDMDSQIAFLIHELPYQGDIINGLNGIDNLFDGAALFMRKFERPRDQSNAKAQVRADRGQFFIDAFNAELGAVNAARAAAEEERKKGLAESFDEANMWADSTGLEIPGFVKHGNDTAFHNGEPYNVGLYEIPGTYDKGKNGPALVNARAIYQANAMFAQMRKDLGLEVIYFGDSYRTMEGQIDADRKDKNAHGHDMGGAASPGWSAHQSGYAFDISMGLDNGGQKDVGYTAGVNSKYPGNRVWEWLKANAAKYHFYQWDPEGWHWSINGK